MLQLVPQVAVAQVVQVQDTVYAHLVVAFTPLVVLHLLPLLVGGRVAPARTVHEEILGKPFNVYDFLAVLDIEGVEVAPKGFFPESLEYTMDTSRMPR